MSCSCWRQNCCDGPCPDCEPEEAAAVAGGTESQDCGCGWDGVMLGFACGVFVMVVLWIVF